MKSSTTSHCLTLLRCLYMQSRCMLRQDCMTADTASHRPRCFSSKVEQQITSISWLQHGSTLPIDDAINLKFHYIWYGMISSRYNTLCIIRSYGRGVWGVEGCYGKLTLAFCGAVSTLLPALSVACCASLPTEPACDFASWPACLPLLARSLV